MKNAQWVTSNQDTLSEEKMSCLKSSGDDRV